jgi:Dolichyl-phosphate-mannose-protein mannosyltransferase
MSHPDLLTSPLMDSAPNSHAAPRTNQTESLPLWVFLIAGLYFLAHMLTATHYGYFRDALYYLACSEHMDWGYVDQPPLIVLIAWITRHTIGTSLPALIFWPALAGTARIVLTAAFARELGARKFGMSFAAVLAVIPAVWYVNDHQFAMNAFEPLFWTGSAFVITRMIKTGNPKLWLVFGAIPGLGLQNKYSMGAFAFALLAGLLLTRERKLLFTPWLFAGGAIALLIFLPNLLWNIQHHWPFLELMRNIRASGRDVVYSPLGFLWQQILMTTPASFPFWFGGLLYLLFSQRMKMFRAFGWAFVITIAFFLVAHGKNYYCAPVYPLVLAGAAVAIEAMLDSPLLSRRPLFTAVLKPVFVLWLFLGLALILPVVFPVLPIESYLRYQGKLPIHPPRNENQNFAIDLPQHYSDEFGWPEMVAAVARVYHSLPPEEQAKTAIFVDNYGEAAAIDFFGPRYGLPKAICTHQNYFLWGPRNYTGEIVIRVGAPIGPVRESYESVEIAATLDNPYAMANEVRPILLCRRRKANLQTDWPAMKHWG